MTGSYKRRVSRPNSHGSRLGTSFREKHLVYENRKLKNGLKKLNVTFDNASKRLDNMGRRKSW